MIRIKEVKLNNFRCYDSCSTQFSDNINIIYGNNATGKTSIVEAISLLSICKSFKTNNDKELIKFDTDCFFNSYIVTKDNDKITIKLSCDGKNKKLIVNNKAIKTISSFVGTIKTVTFSPDDARIITDDPKRRRKFLDSNISVLDKEYLNALTDYNKVLKERNELLKQTDNIDNNLLSIYNDSLISNGKVIINKRNDFINRINKYYNNKINTLSLGKDCGKLVYKPNVSVDDIELTFLNTVNYDLITKTTNCGPHRDNFEVVLNDNEASAYGSKGQIKTLALALILSLVDIFKDIDDNIVIVLDDVFGELDFERQNQILQLLDDKYQLFITTTTIENINKEIIEKSKIIETNRKEK